MSRHRTIAPRALPVLLPLLALIPLSASASLSPARAATQDSGPGGGALATVVGTVYDSLAGKPLAGALVQLVARDGGAEVRSVRSGAEGVFQVSELPHGRYLMGFMHPVLDSLGLDVPPQLLEVTGDSVVHAALAIPSALAILTQICPGPRQPDDSTGLVIGFIRDAETGMPLDSATVLVTWTELVVARKEIHANRRELRVNARSDGWYALCGAPTESQLTARAQRGEARTGYVEFLVPPRGLVHRDFSISRAAAVVLSDGAAPLADSARQRPRPGTARLAGVVRNERGSVLGGALLVVRGSGVSGSTAGDGTFLLSRLPAGTQTLEVRYVGYTPKRMTVDLASNQTRSVDITLDERADVLDEVVVLGKPGRQRREINNFLERRRQGIGHFITRAEIEKENPFLVTDVLRNVPGLRVVRSLNFDDYRIVSQHGARGPCLPQIFIDGVRASEATRLNAILRPGDIAGVEVYNASEAPPQYTTGSCGAILIWMGPDLGAAKRQQERE